MKNSTEKAFNLDGGQEIANITKGKALGISILLILGGVYLIYVWFDLLTKTDLVTLDAMTALNFIVVVGIMMIVIAFFTLYSAFKKPKN